MNTIIALLTRVLGFLNTLLSLVGLIQGQTIKAAQENVPFSIDTNVSIIKEIATDATFGNAALLAAIVAVQSQQLADTASLTTQIENLTNGVTPISLPPTAPGGYGGLTATETGDAVWYWASALSAFPAYEWLIKAGDGGAYTLWLYEDDNWGHYFIPLNTEIHWVFGATGDMPSFDPTDILADENLVTCLTRQNVGWDVTWQANVGGFARLHGSLGLDVEDWVTVIDDTYFNLIKAEIFPLAAGLNPPVWPGLASVTLGTPVDLAPQLTVIGPMDGVLINIADVTINKPSLDYDGEVAYKFIGALAFVTDNGDAEMFQALGFASAVYSPTTMTQAATCVLRCDPSLVGTVTPWVIG